MMGKIKTLLICISLVFGLCFCVLTQNSLAQSDQGDKNQTPAARLDWISPPEAHYTLARSKDPFKPFVFSRSESEESKKKSSRPLTPLEKVEVSQLKLVGILWYPGAPEKAKAMVQLPDGKGYMLREGDRVGSKSGKVVSISPDRVLVREKVVDVLGKSKNKDILLKVRKDDEENN